MPRKSTTYKQILNILEELHKQHPAYLMGQHLSTALEPYGDLWGVSDKEILFALEKYMATLELGEQIAPDIEVEKIVEEGKHLDKLFLNEEGEEDEY